VDRFRASDPDDSGADSVIAYLRGRAVPV